MRDQGGPGRAPRKSERRPGSERKNDRRVSNTEEWLTLNGWIVLAHPMLLDQLDRLVAASEHEHETLPHPEQGANTKLLGHLVDLISMRIPRDPGAREFRHGGTLAGRNYWFRAKTGNGRYRLFYRFSSSIHTIVLVWVNDEESLRTYGSKTDAYRVFGEMLEAGNPPDSWDTLYAAAAAKKAATRLARILTDRSAPKSAGGTPVPSRKESTLNKKSRGQ